MRLALSCNFSPWSAYSGGAQRSTHALANALSARGHDVHVVYTATAWDRPTPNGALNYRIHWATFTGLRTRRDAPLRPFNAVSVYRALRRIDDEAPLDVVHAQGEEGALVPNLRCRSRIRFVITPRYPRYPEALHGRAGTVARAKLWLLHTKYPLIGHTIKRADRVCTTSKAAALALEHAFGFEHAKVRVIPNGVDETFLATRWQGPGADGPILFFGRVEHDKGIDTLLRAMVDCPRELVVVGRGKRLAQCHTLAAQLGIAARVRFLDWMAPDALARALSQCALAVLPSRSESFGNAMAETLAVGVPLVTTSAGSIPEVVGDAAEVVPPDSVEALGAAIRRLLADHSRANRLAEAGRLRVQARFTWDAVAAAYEALYSEPS